MPVTPPATVVHCSQCPCRIRRAEHRDDARAPPGRQRLGWGHRHAGAARTARIPLVTDVLMVFTASSVCAAQWGVTTTMSARSSARTGCGPSIESGPMSSAAYPPSAPRRSASDRCIVHQRRASSDQKQSGLHVREPVRVDQDPSTGRVERDHVTAGEVGQCRRFDAGSSGVASGEERIVRRHGRSECQHPGGERSANATEATTPMCRLATSRPRPRPPTLGASVAVRGNDMPQQRKCQGHGMVGNGVGIGARRVRYDNAEIGGSIQSTASMPTPYLAMMRTSSARRRSASGNGAGAGDPGGGSRQDVAQRWEVMVDRTVDHVGAGCPSTHR